MAKDNIKQLLSSRDKGITKTHGSNGVLSRLWRQMLLDLNIQYGQFNQLLQEYVFDPRNGIPNNRKDQISTRGNLIKEFTRTQMTWKVFCKALRFLGIVKVEIYIKAYHHNHKTSDHLTVVNFGTRRETTEFNTALEQTEEQELVQDVQVLNVMNKSE